MMFYRMGYYLGNDYTFYSFTAPGVNYNTQPLNTVEEYANLCRKEILAIEKQQIAIIGHCYGAVVGLETLRPLQQLGINVRLIAIDPIPFLRPRILRHIMNLFELGFWNEIEIPEECMKAAKAASISIAKYKPSPSNISALVIKPLTDLAQYDKWHSLTNATEYIIDSDRRSLFREKSEEMARAISEYLRPAFF